MGFTAHQHKKAISRRKRYKRIRPVRIKSQMRSDIHTCKLIKSPTDNVYQKINLNNVEKERKETKENIDIYIHVIM